MNRYLAYPDEHEFLINRNYYFVVTNTTTLPIVLEDDYRDILTIDVIMCDSLDDAISLTGEAAALIEHHDADIPEAIKKYRAIVEPFISAPRSMIGGDAPVVTAPVSKSSSIIHLSSKIKLHNLNMLIYWDNHNKHRHDAIESLTTDLLNYHNLLVRIYGSKTSKTYETINKPYSTIYILEEIQPVLPSKLTKNSIIKKYPIIPSKNILSQIFQQPLDTISVPALLAPIDQSGGDPYYRKYLKYKSKYLDTKKYI